MSIIFYLIAILIIAVFFKADQKEWPGFSRHLWVPLIWLVVSTTRLIIILFPRGAGYYDSSDMITAYTEANPLIRDILLLLFVLGIIVLRNRKTQLLAILQRGRWLVLFHSYALLSIAWSAYPEISLRRFIKLIGLVIIALIVACEEDYRKAIEHVFRRYLVVCLTLSIFLVKFGKGAGYVTGRMGTRFMAGIATHKNELAILCAFSLTFLVWRALRSRILDFRFDVLLICINIYLLVKAQSATGNVAAVLGVILVIILSIVKGELKRLVLTGLVVLVPALLIFSMTIKSPGSALSGDFFGSVNRDASLTGRVPLWKALLDLGKSKLRFGSGYESFWMENLPTVWNKFESGPTNAHNGYIDIILNLGAVGLGIFILFLINLGHRLAKEANQRDPYTGLWMVFYIIVLLGNITESAFMMLTLHWSLLVIIAVGACRNSLGIPEKLEQAR